MLRINPCRCLARDSRLFAELEFERGACARCGRWLSWALDEVWEDGLGLRALALAVEDAALSLRAAAREAGIETNEDYFAWLETGEAERVDVIGRTKKRWRETVPV